MEYATKSAIRIIKLPVLIISISFSSRVYISQTKYHMHKNEDLYNFYQTERYHHHPKLLFFAPYKSYTGLPDRLEINIIIIYFNNVIYNMLFSYL